MGAEQFLRTFELTVNGIQFTTSDVAFSVKRSLKPKAPNTAEISIYNLSADHRAAIGTYFKVDKTSATKVAGDIPINLLAGYQGQNSLVFSGSLRVAVTERNGPDLVTKISSGDGEKKARKARVAKSYAPKTPILTVIKDLARAMSVGIGNADQALAKAEFPKGGATFPCGTILAGSAPRELEMLLRSCGFEYSIQHGALQILSRGAALGSITASQGKTAGGTALYLTQDTGVIETPAVGSDGIVRAKTTMLPDMFPGRLLKFDMPAAGVVGYFRVSSVETKGDTYGDEWGHEFEAEPLFPSGTDNPTPVNR